MSNLQEAKLAAGEVLWSGFKGLELDPTSADFFKSARIGGMILFAPNYENPAQVAELINSLQECRSTPRGPLWIAVDQEGGRVQRFKKPFTRIPDAQSVGLCDSPKLAFELSEVVAKELRAIGINVNFGPVADINTNPKNPVIGARAYGSTEEVVTKMVTAIVRGYLTNGVIPCVKHFPGHGDTHTDSHFALPRVETTPDVLRKREFIPFIKALKSKCPMLMTAHVLNAHIDDKFPATFSSKVLKSIVREEMGFDDLIITDDMEMKAVTDLYGAEDAARLALEAGCDVVIYRSEAATRVAHESLIKALESGKLAPEIVLKAAARSLRLKREHLPSYEPVVVGDLGDKIETPAHLAIAQKVEEGAAAARER